MANSIALGPGGISRIDVCGTLEAASVRRVGFDDDQALLPYGRRSFRGYRLLHRIPRLPEIVADNVVDRFGLLHKILRASVPDLVEVEGVGEARARSIKDGLARLAESSILERYV